MTVEPAPLPKPPVDRRLRAAERMLAVRKARDGLIDFTRLTMPDPKDPDDPNLSRYSVQYFHRALAAALEKVESGEIKRLIVTMPPRHGKALALDTPVPTPAGWTTMGQIKVGDQVFGADGRPVLVTAVSPVWKDRPVYRVITDDEDEIVADAEHEWPVRLDRKHPVVLNKTTEYLAARTSPRAPMVAAAGPLTLPEADLLVDPYVLGVWLGDGNTSSAAVTSADQEIIDQLELIEGPGGTHYAPVRGTMQYRPGMSYRAGAEKTDTLQGRLRALGVLGDKHVPSAYLRGSAAQRLALLQGLIDSDGYVAPTGQIEFCSTKLALAEGVRELVRSLGRKASLLTGRAVLDGKDCGPKYRVSFYMKDAARLARKAVRCRDAGKCLGRYLAFEAAGRADTVCIEVAAEDHLFLCGRSMIPTHNSELISKRLLAWFVGRDPYRHVALGTYNETFAEDYGREVKSIMNSTAFAQVFPGVTLKKDSQAAGRMNTEAGGALYFVGRGGSITGRGAHLIIIDDPIKNSEEADSARVRDEVWTWFNRDIMSRFMDDQGRCVVVLTRWHEDDLVGRLTDPKNPEYKAEEAAEWKVINIPAIAEEGDLLGRPVGEPLWPSKFGLAYLLGQKRRDPRAFNALYQQRPTAEDGEFFKADHIATYLPHERPPLGQLRIYMASDHAVAEKQHNDRTCILVVGVDKNDNVWVLDCYWKRADTEIVTEKLIDLIEKWKPVTWWAEDDHIVKSIGPFLKKRMRERKVYLGHSKVQGYVDKQKKAQSIKARMSMGMVFFPKNATWVTDAVDELLKFPRGVHDDFVDALSTIGRGLGKMVSAAPPATEQKGPRVGTFGWVKTEAKVRERAERARVNMASL